MTLRSRAEKEAPCTPLSRLNEMPTFSSAGNSGPSTPTTSFSSTHPWRDFGGVPPAPKAPTKRKLRPHNVELLTKTGSPGESLAYLEEEEDASFLPCARLLNFEEETSGRLQSMSMQSASSQKVRPELPVLRPDSAKDPQQLSSSAAGSRHLPAALDDEQTQCSSLQEERQTDHLSSHHCISKVDFRKSVASREDVGQSPLTKRQRLCRSSTISSVPLVVQRSLNRPRRARETTMRRTASTSSFSAISTSPDFSTNLESECPASNCNNEHFEITKPHAKPTVRSHSCDSPIGCPFSLQSKAAYPTIRLRSCSSTFPCLRQHAPALPVSPSPLVRTSNKLDYFEQWWKGDRQSPNSSARVC